jgi:hypothetical protein
MKASELRIGNYVFIKNEVWDELRKTPLKVTGYSLEDDDMFPESTGGVMLVNEKTRFSYSQLDEFIAPIPLTEEWLIRFGFELTNHSKWECIQSGIKRIDKTYSINLEDKDDDFGYESYLHLDLIQCPDSNIVRRIGFKGLDFDKAHCIDYVHQFQNLFFAFTGAELNEITK